MHNSVLCLSTSRASEIVTLDCEETCDIGADYIGDNRPEYVEETVRELFGDIATYIPYKVEEGYEETDGYFGEIVFNTNECREYIRQWVRDFKKFVSDLDMENSFENGNLWITLRNIDTKLQFRTERRTMVKSEWGFDTALTFLNECAVSKKDTIKFYVSGCYDYHY